MKALFIIILAVSALDGYSQADRKFIRQGNREFDDKKYQDAEIQYRKALEKDPNSIAADYNLGNALYKQQQYDAAASRYATLAEKQKGSADLNRQYYNLGNTLYQSGKYKEAIEAYKNALRRIPGDLDAKHNLQLALKKLQEESRQDQQQQKQDQRNQQLNQQQQEQQNQQQQEQQNQQQQEQQENKQQPPDRQNAKGQISPQDAERILQALENEEKDVLRKVQEQQKQAKKIPVDKNW